jgi:uncharacterized protein YndB with AHSA1/START domain
MIRRQVVIPASPQRLWEALTEPRVLRSWFGGQFEWDLAEGSPLRFRGDDGSSREGRVDSVREERHLRFSWWPTDRPDDVSEVSYLIEADEDGARLTVQERPLDTPSTAPSDRRSPTEARSGASDRLAEWTAWDTRLAGAWAGMCGGGPVAMSGRSNLRARA